MFKFFSTKKNHQIADPQLAIIESDIAYLKRQRKQYVSSGMGFWSALGAMLGGGFTFSTASRPVERDSYTAIRLARIDDRLSRLEEMRDEYISGYKPVPM